MTEKLIRQYLRETKKNVACSAKRKRAFLAELETDLRELAQETDNLTPEQLTKTFGTPQQQAQDFMETLDANEVKKAFGWKKIVLVAAVAMMMIWLIGIVIVVIDGHRSANGYSVEEEYEVATDENGSYTEYHKDGYYGIMTLKDEKVIPGSMNAKEKTKEYAYYDSDGNELWSVSITASFTYDGTNATCTDVSKSIAVNDSSWKCKGASCSKSGDTAVGDFTMNRYVFLKPDQSCIRTFTLSCDKDGNIT